MTPQDRYLHSIVNGILPIYTEVPSVKVIALAGSLARGGTDRYSDIDMLVYYDTLPAQEVIEELRTKVPDYQPGAYHSVTPDVAYVEYIYVRGVRCDIAHITLGHWESLLDEVVSAKDTNVMAQKAVGGILDALALYDEQHYLPRWKEKASHYPHELRVKMIEEHMAFYPAWIMEFMAAGRGDMLWYRDLLVSAVKNMLCMLYGLNQIYHQMDFKHLDSIIERMNIAPKDLSLRINRLFTLEPRDAVAELMALLAEVLSFVEEHLPEVDCSRARKRLSVHYEGWDIPDEQKP